LKTGLGCSVAGLWMKSKPNHNFFIDANVFAALFCVYGDFQNSKQKAGEKPDHEVRKLKSKIYLFLG